MKQYKFAVKDYLKQKKKKEELIAEQYNTYLEERRKMEIAGIQLEDRISKAEFKELREIFIEDRRDKGLYTRNERVGGMMARDDRLSSIKQANMFAKLYNEIKTINSETGISDGFTAKRITSGEIARMDSAKRGSFITMLKDVYDQNESVYLLQDVLWGS